MPRSPLILIVVLLTTFGLGVMAGNFLTRSTAAQGQDAAREARGSAPAAGTLDWSGQELQEFDLKNQSAGLARQAADLDGRKEALILKDHLALYNKYKLSPQSFGDDLHVTNAMASFLNMSAAERKDVDGHLAEIHSQVQALAKQHLKLAAQTDDSMTYEIEPFPEGSTLKGQLKSQLEGDLGNDRGDVFMDSAGWEMNQTFASFGSGKVDLKVTRLDKGSNPYHVDETFPDGSGIGQGTSNSVPAPFNDLVQLDPDK